MVLSLKLKLQDFYMISVTFIIVVSIVNEAHHSKRSNKVTKKEKNVASRSIILESWL